MKVKAIAFDEIDKAPEEKKRGITIAMVIIIQIPAYPVYSKDPIFNFTNTEIWKMFIELTSGFTFGLAGPCRI